MIIIQQADSFVSGSISFGRFESEDLCWERRSSFSHNRNRYIEEVEKCSKPGSVTEKKAILEAHFRNKGGILPFISSPTTWTNTDSPTPIISKLDETTTDTSVRGSMEQQGQVSGSWIEYSCDSTRNFDFNSECLMAEEEEEEHRANSGSLLTTNSRLETEEKQVLDCDESKSDVSNTIVDKHGAEEYRDATPTPKGQQVSSSEPCCFRTSNFNCVQTWLIELCS